MRYRNADGMIRCGMQSMGERGADHTGMRDDDLRFMRETCSCLVHPAADTGHQGGKAVTARRLQLGGDE